jgi:hypothetical protein
MRFIIFCLTLLFSFTTFAGSKIEAWKNGETIQCVIRDEQGRFMTRAELSLESWNDADKISEWVARKADGTFITGYKGYLEKFKVRAQSREDLRLVIRNSKGSFITWKAVDDLMTAGFERMDLDRDGNKETIYAIRYNNRLVNWAKAKLESWKNMKYPVLVVRDSADSKNNGKLLAWIAAEKLSSGKLIYRDPETGRFVSPNN